MAPFVQLLIFGVPALLALVAYLLPGVRVIRSIAGTLCILAAGFLVSLMLRADMMEAMPLLGMVVLLSALIIAVRPEYKPKPADSAPPVRPAPLAQPYAQQGYPAQPQSHPQSPAHAQPQHQPQHAQPQQLPPQRQPEHSVQTPPAQPPQPQRAMPPQSPPQQSGPGYPGSGG